MRSIAVIGFKEIERLKNTNSENIEFRIVSLYYVSVCRAWLGSQFWSENVGTYDTYHCSNESNGHSLDCPTKNGMEWVTVCASISLWARSQSRTQTSLTQTGLAILSNIDSNRTLETEAKHWPQESSEETERATQEWLECETIREMTVSINELLE